jgi:hypothetical protein
MNFPGERAASLNADHNGACKYDSPQDPNYILVRNALKTLVSKYLAAKNQSRQQQAIARRESHDLNSVLGISSSPNTDYRFYNDQRGPDTSIWILYDERFNEWLSGTEHKSSVLWLHGGPASGKSVLVSTIINSMVLNGRETQYFFIRYENQKTRSLNLLLRSLAYQIAKQVPTVLRAIIDLGNEASDLELAAPNVIWERIFRAIIFKAEINKPIYWIVDGLDEAADSCEFLRLLNDIVSAQPVIRIIVSSRPINAVAECLKRLSGELRQFHICVEGHTDDIRSYVCHALHMSEKSESFEDLVEKIVNGSENNFLVSDRGHQGERQADRHSGCDSQSRD